MARSAACAATTPGTMPTSSARAAARIFGRLQQQAHAAGEDHALAMTAHLDALGIDLAIRPVAADRPVAGHAAGARIDAQALGHDGVAAIVARRDVALEIQLALAAI